MGTLYESRESSSPMITRAVAAALGNQKFSPYEFPLYQRIALSIVGLFHQNLASWVIPRAQPISALDKREIEDLQIDGLIQNRLKDYSKLDRKFPAIVCGVGMGGTTTHICTSLEALFLPQAFVMTLKGGTRTGDVNEYINRSLDLAKKITDRNPEVMTIQHYDPIHDGWLVKNVNHLRLKLINLPAGYKEFIIQHLAPGGEIIYLEGRASWLRYRLGLRNVFQLGGWGDISAREFLEGSSRIVEFCQKEGISSNWKLTGYELEEGPESEWGSEPGLKEALADFCEKQGFKFIPISFKDPNLFSRLAFSAVKRQLEQSGQKPQGSIIEMFSQYDPDAVANYGILPLWLIFNTKDSARFLQSSIHDLPKDIPLFFSPLSTFSHTPDIASFDEWEKSLKEFSVINIGARKTHYPADATALVSWQENLEKWKKQHSKVKLDRISGKLLKEMTEEIQKTYPE